ECRVVLESAGEVGSRLDVRAPADLGGPDVTPLPGSTVVADAVSAGRAEHVARRLAALRDATPRLADGGLPRQVRLLDVLGLGVPGLDATDPAVVAERWRRGGRSTRAMLGAGRDGVVAPDLRRDGPHVLVGGTTGSGKSELLQTLVTSLAVANRPDELTFLLVDYKGGAAFADCARLPHTVGLVTDLDEHLTRRALTSLGAEVKRRERLLRDAGAADVDHYVERAGPGAMPRLVIVVDEFRVLADELPEFVDGLVRLAAVGRSLGLHLVLATQRPGGVVGPDIAANVNLRIALRVRDRADSTDVVESPEAAAIDASLPGRAVLRTGSGPLVELQTARVSHRQGPVGESRERRPPVVRRELWRGTPPPDERAPEGGDAPTDLARIVDALSDAAGRCGTARPGGLWIPPLPEVLHRAALPSSTEEALVLGLRDEPAAQAQPPAVLRLRPGTALAVVGTARSGRTGVLASVAAAASRVPADRVHLHAVLGSGAAPPGLSGLPQVGTVVGRDDPDRLARLLRRLADEVERRRSSGGPADGAAVVLLVDGWEAAHRLLDDPQHGAALEHLLQVVREGPAVAVSTVLAGDRSLLTGRLASALTQRLLLRTADPTDAVLAGVPVHDLPRVMPPGRGMWVDEHGVAEVQVADPGRLESSVVRPAAGGPFVVRALPRGVAESELRGADAPPLPVGVGGEDVVPVGFTVAECTGLVVAGPPGSGRSTALAVLGRALRRAGVPVVVVAPRASSLADAVPGAVVVRDLHDPVPVGRACEHRGTVVLVDDVVAAEGSAVLDAVERHLAAGGGTVLAGEPAELAARFRGPVAEARRSRTGLLLSPTGYADGDVLGVSVPRAAAVAPGRGVVVRRGVAQTVQVALPATPQPMGPRDDPSRPGMLTP
ncbi:MAG: FtsK/SpoIIIE domain-containing protein, partial [Actinomycetes bacterium]